MLATALCAIDHQPEIPLAMKYPSAMSDRGRQTRVSVVTALEEIKLVTGNPIFDFDPQRILPRKRTRDLCLVLSVDLHRVMSPGSAEAVALATVANILERSRI